MVDNQDFIEQELQDLSYSTEYAEFIMANGDDTRVICNGDTLMMAMEDLYLWEDFLKSKGIKSGT